ncbi:MAG: SRPBCC domain-containing protein [Myxococcota bacterium]
MTIFDHRIYIAAPYQTVWEHLTRAERYESWFSAPGLSFGSRPGDSVAWGSTDRTAIVGRLLAIEHGKGLRHSFAFAFVEPREDTEVEWTVLAAGAVVDLRVQHDVTHAPNTARTIGEAGWTKALCRLKTLIETGKPMPWPSEDAPS